MGSLLAAVNAILSFITPISDFFWDFPKNFEWYREIPLLGDFFTGNYCIGRFRYLFHIKFGFYTNQIF